MSPEDNVFVDSLVFFHHPWVICLCPGNVAVPGMIKQDSYRLRVQSLGDRLIMSVTLLSAPLRYSMVMSYLAMVATHWCPVASRLGVVII